MRIPLCGLCACFAIILICGCEGEKPLAKKKGNTSQAFHEVSKPKVRNTRSRKPAKAGVVKPRVAVKYIDIDSLIDDKKLRYNISNELYQLKTNGTTKIASLTESVGDIWFRQFTELMI